MRGEGGRETDHFVAEDLAVGVAEHSDRFEGERVLRKLCTLGELLLVLFEALLASEGATHCWREKISSLPGPYAARTGNAPSRRS